MKRIFFSLAMVALLMSGCYKDDIDELNKQYDSMNTILTALQQQLSVTSVTPTSDGYRITFSDGSTADLKQGKDGANGANGANAPTITDIVYKDGNVEFKFSNGQTITMPMAPNFNYSIAANAAVQYFEPGQSREFTITQSGVQNIAISKPDGWKASVKGDKLTVTAPASANTFAEQSGVVSIVAMGNNASTIASVQVYVWNYNYLIDFEAPAVLAYLAGPTAAGENLYQSVYMNPDGVPLVGKYQDGATGLYMTINESGGSIDFWNGGVAISQWNDMATPSSPNQCSVYYSDATTHFGGYGGSKTFAVANDGGQISFEDGITECAFDHFYVTNSTYAALSMQNGDAFGAKVFSYADHDWFKLIITAVDKDGNDTGTPVEFYLADFRTATSPGIITNWTAVDLSPLGNHVHTITFEFDSSDIGQYGMNTPSYFCFDNLAIRK